MILYKSVLCVSSAQIYALQCHGQYVWNFIHKNSIGHCTIHDLHTREKLRIIYIIPGYKHTGIDISSCQYLRE